MKKQTLPLVICALAVTVSLAGCGGETSSTLPPVVKVTPTTENVFGTFAVSTPLPTVASTSTVAPSDTSTPQVHLTGDIALLSGSWNDYQLDLYTMDIDGSGLTQLTVDGGVARGASWSPDGTRILFLSRRNSSPSVNVINADGSTQSLLPIGISADSIGWLSWSPDGTQIAVVSPSVGFYLVKADGSGQITFQSSEYAYPSWSPDGTQLVVVCARGSNPEICVINSDGSGEIQLTNNTAQDNFPVWSPDGKRIVFVSWRDGAPASYIMNADGSEQIRLSEAPIDFSVWSPDSSRVALISMTGVYVVNADGSGQVRLPDEIDMADTIFDWSPDSTRIVFTSRRDGNLEIYVINADGSELARLTDSPTDELAPAWRP